MNVTPTATRATATRTAAATTIAVTEPRQPHSKQKLSSGMALFDSADGQRWKEALALYDEVPVLSVAAGV